MLSSDRMLCGWRLRSALPLPELLPWTGPQDAPPDVTLVEEEVPETLDNPVWQGPVQVVGQDGAVLLLIPHNVRILTRRNGRISLQRLGGPSDDWRPFLLGSALSYLCHQRGLLPLHAASLVPGGGSGSGGAMAILGQSGRGKSTLAFQMVRRGGTLISDDMTPVRTGPLGPEVIPAFPRMKLWGQTLSALGVSSEHLSRIQAGLDKFDLGLHAKDAFDPHPRPLTALVVLTDGPDLSLTRLSAAAGLAAVNSHIHRPRIAGHLGQRSRVFAEVAAIARSVPVFRLSRPRRMEILDRTAALIEETLG